MRVVMEVGKTYPEITGSQADEFAKELLKLEESDITEVILDFSEITTISSMAMGSLFSTFQSLKGQGRTIKLINTSENIERLLKLVNMGDILETNEE